jgi:hypothetical protein
LAVLPAVCDAADETVVDGVAGAVLADVFDELCVLEVPPLTVGWTVMAGWILIV